MWKQLYEWAKQLFMPMAVCGNGARACFSGQDRDISDGTLPPSVAKELCLEVGYFFQPEATSEKKLL